MHRLMDAVCSGATRTAAPVRSLKVENLEKRYGETVALTGATIGFKPGSVHTILGENGSGKSTLLKILSGIVQPSEGDVFLNGNRVSAGAPRDMQALGLATVFQEVLIAPHRSVVENVFLGYDGMFLRNIDKSHRIAATEALLAAIARTEIDVHAPAGSLPLAAQQLVVIARAFARLPSILLLDEATAALDFADREQVFEAIEDYARAGHIVIFISHRMEEVKRLSDRVTVLRSGRVVETIERDSISSALLLKLMAPEANIHVE
jgi:ribose transport system ATP-binding protein